MPRSNRARLAWLRTTLLACAVDVAIPAAGQPRLGERFPPFMAIDLAGRVHSSGELRGRPTLLVVVTGRAAAERTQVWLDEARRRYPGSRVHVVAVVTLDLSGPTTLGIVRSVLRGRVSEQFWPETWLDANGRMGRALGLRMDLSQPYIIALDPQGSIIAELHGGLDADTAGAIWAVLNVR